MSFAASVHGPPAESFNHLFALADAELAKRGFAGRNQQQRRGFLCGIPALSLSREVEDAGGL
jgi:hypothetical protein